MRETIINRLLTIKSIVTLLITIVFCALSITGAVTAEQFYQIFLVIIAFYFGTQAEKNTG